MRIEDYFSRIARTIADCPWVTAASVSYDQRGPSEGFLRGTIFFLDGSLLHLREFVECERKVDRLVYAYQYMDSRDRLVFRYDNTGHHRKLGLSSYPHHKHDGSEDTVVVSHAPSLAEVLDEIAQRLPA